jgi:uncharacterized membrane protein YbhN (UPF0104 family)
MAFRQSNSATRSLRPAYRLRDWLLGLSLFGLVVVWVHQQVGWGQVLAPWKAQSITGLAGLFGLAVLSYLFRALRVYDYFSHLLAGRFLTVLKVSVLHNLANNLLPMRLGELAFPMLMHRHFGLGMGRGALSLLWIRLLDLHVLGLVALLAMGILFSPWVAAVLTLVWSAGVLLLRWLLPWLHWRLENTRVGVVTSLLLETAPTENGRFARAYLWTLLSWGSKLTAFTLVMVSFTGLPPATALVGVLGAELSSVLPVHGVAGTGSYEAAGVAALALSGVPVAGALTATVNLHLFLLGVTLLLGFFAIFLPAGSTAHGAISADTNGSAP